MTGFACDMLTPEYDEQLLEAITTLSTSDIPCTWMVHMQWFTCGELLVMTTSNNRHIMLYELSLERL